MTYVLTTGGGAGLSSSATTALTALAALVTALMAVVAWRSSRRLQTFQRQEAERDQATQALTERAELLHAEHEGWEAIIREQRQHGRELERRLKLADTERQALRRELHDALLEIIDMRQEMHRVRTGFEKRIRDLEGQLERRRQPSKPRPGGRRKTDPEAPD